MQELVSFSSALLECKAGRRIAREGWNGKRMWVRLITPNGPNCELHLPYLQMKTADGKFVPWLASQTDILADDWFCPVYE